MESRNVTHIVFSSLSLVCICVQSFFQVRSAIRLERAELPRPSTYTWRATQILPVITAITGLAYCGCNLVLRSGGRQHAEYMTRVLLAFVVLFSESATAAELAYFYWAKDKVWVMDSVQCGVVGTGISSIALRILARQSHLLGSLALWVPPALSSIVEGLLLMMQISLVWNTEHAFTKNVCRVAPLASRQFGLLPFWAWTFLSDRPIGMLIFQHVQVLVAIHHPRHWPGPVRRRKARQQAALSEGTNGNRARQTPSDAQWEEDESRTNLVPSRSGDA